MYKPEKTEHLKEKNLQAKDSINRKQALEKLAHSGKKVMLTALPLSLIGLTAEQAYAQFDDLEVVRALNFILQIEFMEEAFYVQTTTRNGLIDAPYQSIFNQMRGQHQGRVVLIKNNIASFGLDAAPQLNFNFRSGDINPFSSFDQFLNLAQVIEDLAAGVYKEQAGNIFQNNTSNITKRLVLRLHSTEARHAYYIRFLRAQRGLDDIKGWINQNNLGNLSDTFANIYAQEDNTMQQGIDVTSITEANTGAVQEAWDEPIGRGLAGNILQLFTNPFEQ